MKVRMILPALTEATSPFWRPIRVLAVSTARPGLRHVVYAAGWKKFEPLWMPSSARGVQG